jgi:hypothetical protein
MTTTHRSLILIVSLLAAAAVTLGAGWLGYRSARADGPGSAFMVDDVGAGLSTHVVTATMPSGDTHTIHDASKVTLDGQPVLEQLADLQAKYEALKAARGAGPDAMMLAWAALLAGVLKVLLSVMGRLWPKPKKWTAWVAMALAVPIALLSHFAAGHSWLESLIVAGGGPGAVIVHELMKLIPARPSAKVLPATLVVALVACGPGPGPLPVIGQTIIDCTGANRTEIDALFLELSPLIGLSSPDWAAVYQRAKHAGAAIGGCALAELVQMYLGGRKARATDDSWAAHDALERFRAEVAGGATFKTKAGNL